LSNLCCGIDEAGRGPVLGPMVMAIVCSSNEAMASLGAKDSKTLTPRSREKIFELISRDSEFFSYEIIGSETLNQMMNSMTLNKIEEEFALRLIDTHTCNQIFVDAFDVNEERLSHILSEKSKKNVTCKHRGDSIFPVVSAASIVAKVIRDREIEKLRKTYGNFGSGYPSDPSTIIFLKNAILKGVDISKIVRTHWVTYKNIIKQIDQKKL
jgi:ribonuclease HII